VVKLEHALLVVAAAPISAAGRARRPPRNSGGGSAHNGRSLRGGTSCCGSRKRLGRNWARRRPESAWRRLPARAYARKSNGETDEEIRARIAAAADRAQAEAGLQRCERKLAEIGDGRTIAALDTEVAAIAADLFDSELAWLQLESERLTQERREAAAEEHRLVPELRQIESGGRKGAASAPGPNSRRDGGGHAKKFAPVITSRGSRILSGAVRRLTRS
jgi:hypothetical protein